jgi:predicted O-methyltransferase YrrM
MEYGITFNVDTKGFSFANFKGVRGYLNQNDCRELIRHAKSLPENALYAEIGSYFGCSAHLIASYSDAKVWAHDWWAEDETGVLCDPPSDVFHKFIENVKRNSFEERIIPVIGKSVDTIKTHEDQILDLSFVDGDHTYDGAKADFHNILPKMKKGGVILAHDCTPGSDCIRAITDFAAETGQTFEILPGTCGMGRIVVV